MKNILICFLILICPFFSLNADNTKLSNISNKDTYMVISPKMGIFSLVDSVVSKYHGVDILFGIDTTIWKKELGIRLEVERYRDTYKENNVALYSNSVYIGRYDIKETMLIIPVWISLLQKNTFWKYLHYGCGIGFVPANRQLYFDRYKSTMQETFFGIQLLTSISNESVGFTLKYSNVNTNSDWSKVGLGGISVLFNYNFCFYSQEKNSNENKASNISTNQDKSEIIKEIKEDIEKIPKIDLK
ncbi:MAG: hypothetical protein JW871_07420 [Endomicrobiales bacterium]|nr:hypothetical protein [Endomicrobiales bacterium]